MYYRNGVGQSRVINCYGVKMPRCKLLRGWGGGGGGYVGCVGHILSTITWVPGKYTFVSYDQIPSIWYSL